MPKQDPDRQARLAAALRENLRKRKAGKEKPVNESPISGEVYTESPL